MTMWCAIPAELIRHIINEVAGGGDAHDVMRRYTTAARLARTCRSLRSRSVAEQYECAYDAQVAVAHQRVIARVHATAAKVTQATLTWTCHTSATRITLVQLPSWDGDPHITIGSMSGHVLDHVVDHLSREPHALHHSPKAHLHFDGSDSDVVDRDAHVDASSSIAIAWRRWRTMYDAVSSTTHAPRYWSRMCHIGCTDALASSRHCDFSDYGDVPRIALGAVIDGRNRFAGSDDDDDVMSAQKRLFVELCECVMSHCLASCAKSRRLTWIVGSFDVTLVHV